MNWVGIITVIFVVLFITILVSASREANRRWPNYKKQ